MFTNIVPVRWELLFRLFAGDTGRLWFRFRSAFELEDTEPESTGKPNSEKPEFVPKAARELSGIDIPDWQL